MNRIAIILLFCLTLLTINAVGLERRGAFESCNVEIEFFEKNDKNPSQDDIKTFQKLRIINLDNQRIFRPAFNMNNLFDQVDSGMVCVSYSEGKFRKFEVLKLDCSGKDTVKLRVDVTAKKNGEKRLGVVSSKRGKVVSGRALKIPKPTISSVARKSRASGTVTVSIIIGKEGNVVSAVAVSGHPLLRPSAEAAAARAKFEVTRLDGLPVIVSGQMEYNFRTK